MSLPLASDIFHIQITKILMKIRTLLTSLAMVSIILFTTSCESKDDSDTPPATINETYPSNNSAGVSRSAVISATFSGSMNASTITNSSFIVTQGTTQVAGNVSYSGNVAVFTPTNNLMAAKVYTATLTTAVKNLAGTAIATPKIWSFTTGGSLTTLSGVNLGASSNYVILAKTAINNASTSTIVGDLGLSPAATSYVTGLALTNATGYATSAQITGKVFAADMAAPTPINLTTAVENMITAYNDAAGRPSPDFVEYATGNLGGKTLYSGLYKWTNSVTIPTAMTISGSATDIWIFQIAGNLNMSAGINITLAGGAQAKNIFWQVAGQATFGTTSHFEGNLLSMTGITLQTGASMTGRALAQTAVILDGSTITKPQ